MTALTESALLAALETLEAERINLGLYEAPIDAQLLTHHLASSYPSLDAHDVLTLLRNLCDEGEVLEWRPGCFRSRVAETVRVLKTLRQRFWGKGIAESPLLIEDVRVEFRSRRRPQRDAVRLESVGELSVPLVLRQALVQAAGFDTVSGFQARAGSEILACSQAGNRDELAFIVAGDTGAGKTEAFLFPILLDIAAERPPIRDLPGVRALLVYPRIRLARNQLARILGYVSRFARAGGRPLTVGMQNGDLPADASTLRKWKSRNHAGRCQHRVEMLDQCVEPGCSSPYWVDADDPDLETGFPRMTCDQGHEISSLVLTKKALERVSPHILLITDVSLSQWLAREKYGHLWGLWSEGQVMTPPRFLVLDEVHLYERLKGAHIARLIKRFQARVRLVGTHHPFERFHPIVIGVSATLQDERRFLAKLMAVDPATPDYDRLKVIKPRADELVTTRGRERYIFLLPRQISPTPSRPEYRVNDQTAAVQIVMAAMHNLKNAPDWRGVAFFDSINDLRQFGQNYAGATGANNQELWRIRTDRRRGQSRDTAGCMPSCQQRARAGTLQDCPNFRKGDCWVFAKSPTSNQRLRVADPVYSGARADLDRPDLIPASPSLEVGYDDEAIQLVYQHKAPSNAASFIQRRGRAGRNPDDSPIIITLLWPYRRDDAFYFFRPEALYDPSFDESPLNADNFTIQRSHAVLAFFDLLACLRRQNIGGIRHNEEIPDVTDSLKLKVPAGNLRTFKRMHDPKRAGAERIVVEHAKQKAPIWFSGGQMQHVEERQGKLYISGWLALKTGLAPRVMEAAWNRLNTNELFKTYLESSCIASETFQAHRTNPFASPTPAIIEQFLAPDMHADKGNWLESFKLIDWNLLGNNEATLLQVEVPASNPGESATLKDLSFGLADLLPGNVTFRLGEANASHWTPIPARGASTFCFPTSEQDQPTGFKLTDVTGQSDSIFGVPRYLNERFPGLRLMEVSRLAVKRFGSMQGRKGDWVYLPDPADPHEGRTILQGAPGSTLPPGAFIVSSRSSTRANSLVIPYIQAARRSRQSYLEAPLNTLFTGIDGYLDPTGAMLGYHRVFYDMTIDVKGEQGASATLQREFYPPVPQKDAAGQPRPILVGYKVETQGIRFEVNPAFLADVTLLVKQDDALRVRLRRNFALYRLAPAAQSFGLFVKQFIDHGALAIDYWLEVIRSEGNVRKLDAVRDSAALEAYLDSHRLVDAATSQQFSTFLSNQPGWFDTVNRVLETTFREGPEFDDFVTSVVLHSLTALLKTLIARLGGVSGDDLVAYADLPILERVDRSIYPRILVMDTVEGGSGGIAQAFERIGSTGHAGSLWWMLQAELGQCPIGHGEALERAVLSQVTSEQIERVRSSAERDALESLLKETGLGQPDPDAFKALARKVFGVIQISEDLILSPALIVAELFRIQERLARESIGPVLRETVVRQAVLSLDPETQPALASFRDALGSLGIPQGNLDREFGLQLLALFQSTCEDGCPVCLSANSDVEHHHLAPLLNSRHVLRKLRETILARLPKDDCLASLADRLVQDRAVRVGGMPGSLLGKAHAGTGVGVVPTVDDRGQVVDTAAIAIDTEIANSLLTERDGWRDRFGGKEHLKYPLRNGEAVRSRAEFIIASKLMDLGIEFEYEQALPYRNEDGKKAYIHPDFYLFEHDIYVEYWGSEAPEYLESRRFKVEVYRRKNIVPIHIEPDEVEHNRFWEKIKARIEQTKT